MKKLSTIIIAAALLMGMAQCKKQETPASAGETVTITLDVSGSSSGSNGSRVSVDTDSGEIKPVGGDRVIVASGNKYVGELEYNGTKFVGDISSTDATVGQPLKFYFLGNLTPQYTMDGANKVGCSVVISDQANSGNRPVISANVSNENYGTTTDYTSELKNKCALVKFNVSTSSSNVATCITGFNNKVTVDFSKLPNERGNDGFAYSQTNDGLIKLAAGNGEKWAILLQQDLLAADGEEEYSFYPDDHCYVGTRPEIHAIGINQLYDAGINLVVTTENFVDFGLPSGKLWAKCNVGAEFHSPKAYGDYFAWGETEPKTTYTVGSYKHCESSEMYEYMGGSFKINEVLQRRHIWQQRLHRHLYHIAARGRRSRGQLG